MKSKKVVFNSRLKTEIVNTEDILYCCSNGSCTNIYLLDDQKISVSRNLCKVQGWLPPSCFIRIHRGTLINIMHVRYIFKGNHHIIQMIDDKKLVIASRRKKEILNKIKSYYLE